MSNSAHLSPFRSKNPLDVPIDCRHFNGYKPCGKSQTCSNQCPSLERTSSSVLIVHLGALGAVVRATTILAMIKRKFPNCQVTWVTDKPADQILKNHPKIDRVLTTTEADLLALSALEFDFGFVVDKSLKAVGVLKRTHVDYLYGFTVEPKTGAIVPATPAAEELWSLGLDNHKKFFENTKPETQLMAEALELPYLQDEYDLPLTKDEAVLVTERRSQLQASSNDILIGLNTGCSHVIPYKKLSIEMHRRLIQELSSWSGVKVVLLGGPEDAERNNIIAEGLPVLRTPENQGLRDGYVSVAAMDIIVTGDSLGMHFAIAAQKPVIAWFGPTCAHEIDIYGRGEKILSKAPCSPCWKRSCQKETMCYDLVSFADLIQAIEKQYRMIRPALEARVF